MSAMATYQCPKGHASTDLNYCSECGARIGASTISRTTPAGAAPSPGTEVCPNCQTARAPGARFCEVCRYDFASGSSTRQEVSSPTGTATMGAPPGASPADQSADQSADQANAANAADSAPSAVGAASALAAAGSASTAPAPRLNVVVVTDPSLAEDEDMRMKGPPNAPELVFPLDLDETLVGRRSDAKKIFPEIDISDPGVSHRHLKLLRQPDGGFAALELGSANGTTLNGVALKAGLLTPVAAGDELIVGMWTRLQLRPR